MRGVRGGKVSGVFGVLFFLTGLTDGGGEGFLLLLAVRGVWGFRAKPRRWLCPPCSVGVGRISLIYHFAYGNGRQGRAE